MVKRKRKYTGWAEAKSLLDTALRQRLGDSATIEIGRVKHLGKGLSRRGFMAHAEVDGHPDWSRDYVVLRPLHDAEAYCGQGPEHEAKVLTGLAEADFPLRVPEWIATLDDEGQPALIETAVHGMALDLRIGRQGSVKPWQIVAAVAAAVHSVDTARFDGLKGFPTRRQHAEAEMAVFDDLDKPLIRDVQAWTVEHLPPATPSVLLHGDLLSQNIRLPFDDQRLGLIDFDRAQLGDPAYDLAIVTRGSQQPFKAKHGLRLLLDDYAALDGQELTAEQVYLHELCMVTGWYKQSLGAGPGHPPEVYLDQLKHLFSRVTAARSGLYASRKVAGEA